MFRSKLMPMAMASMLAISAVGAGVAAAKSKEIGEQNEISAVLNAKTSLAQAIAAAEQHTGGKAVGAGIQDQDGALAYEIEIANGDTVQQVLVELDSGKVIKVMASETNRKEGHEQDED
jgi:uncharacterized membrane protein YkoI